MMQATMKPVVIGLLIPFLGTSLGAACVFSMRKALSQTIQKALSGFAAGVMVAASIWSLLDPAMEQCGHMKQWAFLPAFAGFWLGILFLLVQMRRGCCAVRSFVRCLPG